MVRQSLIYGLDIETDTRIDGLDPGVSSLVAVAISTGKHTEVLTGEEWLLIAALEQYLAALSPGVIATWNGSVFDLPFISDRAAIYGIRLGLRLEAHQQVGLGQAVVGHKTSYLASWHNHVHLDLCQVYKQNQSTGTKLHTSVKSIARSVMAANSTHRRPECNLAHEALHANAARDAELARTLATRRWGTAVAFVDPEPVEFAAAVNHDRRVAAMTQAINLGRRAS